MRNLHDLPRFRDRFSHLYLERCRVDQDSNGLVYHNADGDHSIPIGQISLLMLGPGSTITHAAIRVLAENACLVTWVGEEGVRTYAHSTGATFSARRLILQAKLSSREDTRLEVAKRMYLKRFSGTALDNKSIEQLRGMEGLRVRKSYQDQSKIWKILWDGRNYDQDDWFKASAVNRCLSTANACLYGICHAAIVSAGYSAALGFIHVGKMLSFVYDIADLYKTEVTIPLAFQLCSESEANLEQRTRIACRSAFHDAKLMRRILPDIAEVLNAPDDLGETAEELEGKAISLADGGTTGDFPGPLQQESA
jgi:CRISPR-associated protein Cas1